MQKEELFKMVYSCLKPGGVFINADQVLGETEEIDKVYRTKWIEKVRDKGCTEREMEAALERMKEDKMSPLSHQLSAMSDAGFTQVNCWFKHFSFVVYSGKKC